MMGENMGLIPPAAGHLPTDDSLHAALPKQPSSLLAGSRFVCVKRAVLRAGPELNSTNVGVMHTGGGSGHIGHSRRQGATCTVCWGLDDIGR